MAALQARPGADSGGRRAWVWGLWQTGREKTGQLPPHSPPERTTLSGSTSYWLEMRGVAALFGDLPFWRHASKVTWLSLTGAPEGRGLDWVALGQHPSSLGRSCSEGWASLWPTFSRLLWAVRERWAAPRRAVL